MEDREWAIPAAVGILSFGAGLAAGYFWALRKYDVKTEVIYEKVVELEGDVVKFEHETVQRETAFNNVIESAVLLLHRYSERLGFDVSGEEREIDQPEEQAWVETHVAGPVEDWNYEEELANRSDDTPYVIHRDEFQSNEGDHRQTTLEYYVKDHVLCDELNVPLYDAEKIVGRLEFGRGSGDPDIVYIRNVKLDSEFEVLRNEGSYLQEVLGAEAEEKLGGRDDVQHSVLKFRPD
jgi:hypothetical protein